MGEGGGRVAGECGGRGGVRATLQMPQGVHDPQWVACGGSRTSLGAVGELRFAEALLCGRSSVSVTLVPYPPLSNTSYPLPLPFLGGLSPAPRAPSVYYVGFPCKFSRTAASLLACPQTSLATVSFPGTCSPTGAASW